MNIRGAIRAYRDRVEWPDFINLAVNWFCLSYGISHQWGWVRFSLAIIGSYALYFLLLIARAFLRGPK